MLYTAQRGLDAAAIEDARLRATFLAAPQVLYVLNDGAQMEWQIDHLTAAASATKGLQWPRRSG